MLDGPAQIPTRSGLELFRRLCTSELPKHLLLALGTLVREDELTILTA